MVVKDDLHRLSQLDGIYLGWSVQNTNDGFEAPITSWSKGRLQQANDGNWIFRSISTDGTVVGFQLGSSFPNWTSNETPASGTSVVIPVNLPISAVFGTTTSLPFATVYLQQQLPQEMTN